ncbi:hypothetical protein BSG1_03490 [Bacillus sp. SG-1]|nr:hypothetical protein BSG1_03490 [Bacillus sp. SG-1]
MFPSKRVQRKITAYAFVFKSMGIINVEEMKKLTDHSPK